MPHQWIRANLASSIFPFETDFSGRTVIVAGLDENYNYLNQLGQPVKDPGIPQVYYMHNVLPTPQGYQSIGYALTVTAMVGPQTDFDTIIPLDYLSPEPLRVLLAPAAGKNYVFDAAVGTWQSISPIAVGTLPQNVLVTYAHVNGKSYFFYQGYGMYSYDPVNKVMVSEAMGGLTVADITGIVGAMGYIIAYDIFGNLAWSNPENANDFVPSLITGSGGGSLQYANGAINFGVPISGGFIIYCERNAVSAQYSGNINFPWAFKEVVGSGGCQSIEQVTYPSNAGYHYAWTTAGLQQITPNVASDVFPELTSFFAGRTYEDFDETAITFSQEFLTYPLYSRQAMVANRWVVFSYGKVNGVFTYALIYDSSLARWGKLKITHVKCFEWTAPNVYGNITYGMLGTAQPAVRYGDLQNTTYGQLNAAVNTKEVPEQNLAFMQQDGTIYIVNFDVSEQTADGVLMLGKFQLQRNKFMIHQKCDVNNVEVGNSFAAYVLATLDGQNFVAPVKMSDPPNLVLAGPKLYRMMAEVTGQNISLLFIGAFNMVSIQMDWTMGGDLP